MKNIVLFGPPGSGKGTQATNIITKYNLIHLSTGDMLRAEIAAQTELGMKAKQLMDRGDLVPDAVVIGMIENKLDANASAAGFVFDGFPRTVAQAEALDSLLAKRNAPIQKVLSLKVGEEELTRRILDRGKTSGRADDQNEEIVKNRVVEYRTKTEPLANYYAAQGRLVEIHGEGTVEHITDMICHEIDSIADSRMIAVMPVKRGVIKKAVAKKPVPAKTPAKKAAPKKAAKKNASPKAAAKKAAPKKQVKKVAAKKPIKKAAPKKALTKKTANKKSAPSKAIAKKAASKKPVKKAIAKKAALKKSTAKKAAPKKAIAKKVATKKPVKKGITKKVAVKKAAPKKNTAKKAAPKKTIAKKVATQKPVKKSITKKVTAKKTVKKAVSKKALTKKKTKK